LVALPEIEVGHVDSTSVSALRKRAAVFAELMCLQIHLRLEYYKLLLETFPVAADEVILLKVLLQRIVVKVIVWLPRVPPVADETSFMFVSAMLVQFVIVIKPLAAEATDWVAFESRRGPGLVVSMAHVLAQLFISVHLMFVSKNLLVPCT